MTVICFTGVVSRLQSTAQLIAERERQLDKTGGGGGGGGDTSRWRDTLLHRPLPLVGFSIWMERECQQNDSLVDGQAIPERMGWTGSWSSCESAAECLFLCRRSGHSELVGLESILFLSAAPPSQHRHRIRL